MTATGTKTSVKTRIRAASNFITLIPSPLVRQLLAILCVKDCIEVQEKKKKSFSCVQSGSNKEIKVRY